MIVSLSNTILLCPQQQWGVAARAAWPVFGCRLKNRRVITCLNRWSRLPVRFSVGCSRRRASSVANYEGTWEDPDDGSDDSEDEDDCEEEEEEENDLDYESDWEANGNDKVVVSNADALSTRKYEEELVKEVEQMLGPEERAILEQNEAPNLDILSTEKWKPLHTFALAGQIKFMDGLLEKGYNIEHVDKDGLTPLHLAVIGKREAVISHLLRKGANPEARDQDGATPLHYAVQVGAVQTVKLLMKSKVDVNVADNEGWTPLHVAMQTRNRYIAKILLVNGADINRKNKDGNTALDLSLCYGKDFKSYDLAKMLKQVAASRSF
ncbi:Ankyrin repeat family protein [Perilla frutescens var. hirtella]|uniref:Ankyrin repeat family protein n=1 Tax=Perilla frutescens var. hirtella TaxID=608512 RepID=A0AAD4PD17_PERFH|nr:Ankyrin repeat family protein [Perilla frutescens var. hirtella]